jgi:hypothetical protein
MYKTNRLERSSKRWQRAEQRLLLKTQLGLEGRSKDRRQGQDYRAEIEEWGGTTE